MITKWFELDYLGNITNHFSQVKVLALYVSCSVKPNLVVSQWIILAAVAAFINWAFVDKRKICEEKFISAFTCSEPTIKTVGECVKYLQS